MGAALALGRDLEKAGVILAALLAATVVLGPNVRIRAWAAVGALGLTPVLLVAEIWNTPQFKPLRERPAFAVALAVAGLAGRPSPRRPADRGGRGAPLPNPDRLGR